MTIQAFKYNIIIKVVIQMSQIHKYHSKVLTNHNLKIKFNHTNISHGSTTLKS